MPYQCEKCGREWDDQTAAENEFLCTRTCGGRLVLKETSVIETPVVSRGESPGVSEAESAERHTWCPTDNRGVSEPPGVSAYRGERLLPLIPKLPSTLALVLDEYTREKNDYIALHAMCAALEFTARFLTIDRSWQMG
jgi:DNA-directed RNA polymerase subunit RPC12/RpoP